MNRPLYKETRIRWYHYLTCSHLPGDVWRKGVIRQLKQRERFGESEWVEFLGKNSLGRIIGILKHFEDYIEWPNYYFLPDDPFDLVIIEETFPLSDQMAAVTCMMEIEKNFERNISYGKIDTIGEYVREVILAENE